jgi:hypothetical protein
MKENWLLKNGRAKLVSTNLVACGPAYQLSP